MLCVLCMCMLRVCAVRSKDDFNGFLWNVVMLAMGGLALGQAVQSSGLLLSISSVRTILVTPPPHRTAGNSCLRLPSACDA
jgi:di/tricarboxylate transporter